MSKKLILDVDDSKLWKLVTLHKINNDFNHMNEAVIDLIKKGLKVNE